MVCTSTRDQTADMARNANFVVMNVVLFGSAKQFSMIYQLTVLVSGPQSLLISN